MDNSPRSSKRRKLDTPKRVVSTPLAKGSLENASGLLKARSVSRKNAKAQEEAEENDEDNIEATKTTRKALPKRTTANTPNRGSDLTPQKRGAVVEKDIYDDIEGALSPNPRRRPRSVAPSVRRSSHPLKHIQNSDVSTNGGASDELQEVDTTSKKRKANGALNGESAPRSSIKSTTNGFRNGVEMDTEARDELAREAPTPSKHTKGVRTVNGSTKKTSTPRPVGRPRGSVSKTAKKDSTRKRAITYGEREESSVGTPSVSSKLKTKTLDLFDKLDSDEEVGDRHSPSRTLSAKTKRRTNRTDHIGVEDKFFGPSDDDKEAGVCAELSGNDEDAMDIDGGSMLGSVLDPTEPSPFNKPVSGRKEKDIIPFLQSNLAPGRELDLLKSIIMERITAKRVVPLVGLDMEYKTVYQLIEQTITAGEGNSMLLIGARGSGKTALVNKVLSEVSKDNREDYHVVKLNGFIHTDDKIALREIWRQLGKEMDIEEDGGLGKNYADTLTTLLALLSHPSEQTGELTDQVAKAVVFVMDEFDLFATHPRQTLLYNLFDIAQSRKAPIAVLGLSTRIDVANSLEKRVKSRFSHRYVHLSLANSFTSFQELCKASLLIEPDQLSIEERAILGSAPAYTPSKQSKKPMKAVESDILSEWNRNVSQLFTSKTFLTTFLAPHFYRTKSIPGVLTAFLLPTALLSPANPTLQPTSLLTAPDSKLALIPHLSTLALALLISATRLDIIHDSDTCNFNMAYDEYVTLASKARIQSAAGGASASGAVSKVWGKEVARREWEGLVELGLVVPVVGGVTGGFGMVKCDVALEEVGVVVQREMGIDRALERWCRQL